MAKKTIFRFNGKRFRYIKSKTRHYGYCTERIDGRQVGLIAVRDTLEGRIALDTNIHEMLHACNYYKSEKSVNETARQVAAALWELGYRNINEISKKSKKGRKRRDV